MNKRSFVDLTALLDVMLILFFAAIINMAGNAEQIKEDNQVAQEQMVVKQEQMDEVIAELEMTQQTLKSTLAELENTKNELSFLYGIEVDAVEDYQIILSKISMFDITLASESNQVWINDVNTNINIIKERMEPSTREQILYKEVSNALNLALEQRTKSSIIFMKISLKDREVYKYAYDYLLDIVDDVIENYGKDKVIIYREFY